MPARACPRDPAPRLAHPRRPALPDNQGARPLGISPDGQEVVFEWPPDIFLDQTSSLWITNSVGSSAPRWLANHAGRSAWGRIPPRPAATIYLPTVVRNR